VPAPRFRQVATGFPRKRIARDLRRLASELGGWQAHYATILADENRWTVSPDQVRRADERVYALEHIAHELEQLAEHVGNLGRKEVAP
jgi:ubiquinone biosynthesis protein UbiJ